MAALARSFPADFAGITTPFRSAEEAWFWTASALLARRQGTHAEPGSGRTYRPCEPDDVVLCLDALYRRGRITTAHGVVLRRWGERGQPPETRRPSERRAAQLWREALAWLDWPLRAKGIVA